MAEENVNLENLKEAMDSKTAASAEATDGAEATEAASAAAVEAPARQSMGCLNISLGVSERAQ